MLLTVEAELINGRCGVLARCHRLRLAGCGYDDASAARSLERAVMAWVLGLAESGRLDEALRRTGVKREGGDVAEVRVVVALIEEEVRSPRAAPPAPAGHAP